VLRGLVRLGGVVNGNFGAYLGVAG